jgi:hypothetical protein
MCIVDIDLNDKKMNKDQDQLQISASVVQYRIAGAGAATGRFKNNTVPQF